MKRYGILSFCIIGICLFTMGSAFAKDKDNKIEVLQTQIDNQQQEIDTNTDDIANIQLIPGPQGLEGQCPITLGEFNAVQERISILEAYLLDHIRFEDMDIKF